MNSSTPRYFIVQLRVLITHPVAKRTCSLSCAFIAFLVLTYWHDAFGQIEQSAQSSASAILIKNISEEVAVEQNSTIIEPPLAIVYERSRRRIVHITGNRTAEEKIERDDVDEVIDGNGAVIYSLGAVRVNSLGLPENNPYLVPIEIQIHTEVLRRFLSEVELFDRRSADRVLWRSRLEEIERLVFLALQDIENTSNEAELRLKLNSRRYHYTQLLAALSEDLKRIAERRKYLIVSMAQIQQSMPGQSIALIQRMPRVAQLGNDYAPPGHKVSVATNPPGGVVEYIYRNPYRLCTMFSRTNPPDCRWRLVQNPVKLSGDVMFRVTWSDGRTLPPSLVTINHAGSITLPNNR